LGRQGELFDLCFPCPVLPLLERCGATPLPPYITHAANPQDEARYQTVYARAPGAVAAPTAGLHFDDVARLMRAFRKLLAAGHSLLVIEHNLDVIKTADWVVDMGPEGGDAGGRIVAQGPPEVIAETPASHTGRYLARVLGKINFGEIKPCQIA